MMDEHDILSQEERAARIAIERAREAAVILQSPLWEEAWAKIQGGLIELWQDSRVTDDREETWRYCQITKKLQKFFEDTVRNGEFSKKKLSDAVESKDFMNRLKRSLRPQR